MADLENRRRPARGPRHGRVRAAAPAGPLAPPASLARDNLRGILAMMAAMFALTSNFAFVKLAGRTLPVGEVLFLRGAVAALLISIAVIATKAYRHFPRVLHRTVVWRTLCENAAAVCFVVALMSTSIADVTAILQALPLAITAGAAIWLGETVHWRRWVAIVIGLIGVVIVIRPGFATFQWASTLVLVSVVMSAMRDMSTRRMPEGIPTVLVALVALCSLSLLGLALSLLEDWVVPDRTALLQVTGSGTLLSLGMFFVVLAMRRGELSIIAPFRYSAVLWAIFLGVAVWGEHPDPLTIAGAVIIIGSGIYISFRERTVRATVPTLQSDAVAEVIRQPDREPR